MPKKEVFVVTEMHDTARVDCRASGHTFVIDQPQAGGGNNEGPTPLEYYLASIAGCVSSIARIVARQRHITMRGISIETRGEINTDVLQGKNQSERAGFQNIVMSIKLDADLSAAEKAAFIDEVERRCPVSENTSNPTPVKVGII